MTENGRVVNFGSGPAQLPLEVLQEAQKDFLNYGGTGMSIVESAVFEKVLADAEADLRTLLGGGMGQFAAVPLNLIPAEGGGHVEYLITGRWSERAMQEAQMISGTQIHVISNALVNDKVSDITPQENWESFKDKNSNIIYRYFCDNETVHGVEFPKLPEFSSPAPLVCDMSSNFLTRPVDVSKYDVIFAGAQKNVGISGVVIVIVKDQILKIKKKNFVPTILDFAVNAKGNSLVNTPPTFAIYMAMLTFKWIINNGGLKEMERRSASKSGLLYGCIDSSNGFYKAPVNPGSRSRMNVCFSLKTRELEEKFLKEAKTKGFEGLAGHRSVGGCRAGLFNAITEEHIQKLVEFMKEFQLKNESS